MSSVYDSDSYVSVDLLQIILDEEEEEQRKKKKKTVTGTTPSHSHIVSWISL